MIGLLHAVLQFVLHVSDPHWTCRPTYHEPEVRGTLVLYCTTTEDDLEIGDVGLFVGPS